MIAGRREAVRPVPLGPLRHPGAAAVVPVRRHGEPAPDLRHADRDRRRQVAGVAGRARARAQLVGQPGHQRQLEGHLAERGLHHLRRGPHHRGAVRRRAGRHGTRDRPATNCARNPDRRDRAGRPGAGAAGADRARSGRGARATSPTPRARGSCASSSSASAATTFDAVPARLVRPPRVPERDSDEFVAYLHAEPARQEPGHGHAERSSTRGCTSRASRSSPSAATLARASAPSTRRARLARRKGAAADVDHRRMEHAGVDALPRWHAARR